MNPGQISVVLAGAQTAPTDQQQSGPLSLSTSDAGSYFSIGSHDAGNFGSASFTSVGGERPSPGRDPNSSGSNTTATINGHNGVAAAGTRAPPKRSPTVARVAARPAPSTTAEPLAIEPPNVSPPLWTPATNAGSGALLRLAAAASSPAVVADSPVAAPVSPPRPPLATSVYTQPSAPQSPSAFLFPDGNGGGLGVSEEYNRSFDNNTAPLSGGVLRRGTMAPPSLDSGDADSGRFDAGGISPSGTRADECPSEQVPCLPARATGMRSPTNMSETLEGGPTRDHGASNGSGSETSNDVFSSAHRRRTGKWRVGSSGSSDGGTHGLARRHESRTSTPSAMMSLSPAANIAFSPTERPVSVPPPLILPAVDQRTRRLAGAMLGLVVSETATRADLEGVLRSWGFLVEERRFIAGIDDGSGFVVVDGAAERLGSLVRMPEALLAEAAKRLEPDPSRDSSNTGFAPSIWAASGSLPFVFGEPVPDAALTERGKVIIAILLKVQRGAAKQAASGPSHGVNTTRVATTMRLHAVISSDWRREAADGRMKRWWDHLHLVTICFFTLTVPLINLLWQNLDDDIVFALHCLCRVIWISDVVLSMTLAAFNPETHKVTVVRSEIVALRRVPLIIDALCAIPVDLVAWSVIRASTQCWLPESASFRLEGLRCSGSSGLVVLFFVVRFFQMAKMVRVAYLYPIVNVDTLGPDSVDFFFGARPLILLIYAALSVVHLVSCGWIMIFPGHKYLDASVDIVAMFTGAGPGVETGDAVLQQWTVLALTLAGVLLQGFAIGHLSGVVFRNDVESMNLDTMRETLAVLEHFHVPAETQREILSYQHHVLSDDASRYLDQMESLPPQLQREVMVYVRVDAVERVNHFKGAGMDCKLSLASHLQRVIAEPDVEVVAVGDIGEEMYMVAHGYLDVILVNGLVVATLTAGDYFGEAALLQETCTRNGTVRTLTYCDMWMLAKEQLLVSLLMFPALLESLVASLEAKKMDTTFITGHAKRLRAQFAASKAEGPVDQDNAYLVAAAIASIRGGAETRDALLNHEQPLPSSSALESAATRPAIGLSREHAIAAAAAGAANSIRTDKPSTLAAGLSLASGTLNQSATATRSLGNSLSRRAPSSGDASPTGEATGGAKPSRLRSAAVSPAAEPGTAPKPVLRRRSSGAHAPGLPPRSPAPQPQIAVSMDMPVHGATMGSDATGMASLENEESALLEPASFIGGMLQHVSDRKALEDATGAVDAAFGDSQTSRLRGAGGSGGKIARTSDASQSERLLPDGNHSADPQPRVHFDDPLEAGGLLLGAAAPEWPAPASDVSPAVAAATALLNADSAVRSASPCDDGEIMFLFNTGGAMMGSTADIPAAATRLDAPSRMRSLSRVGNPTPWGRHGGGGGVSPSHQRQSTLAAAFPNSSFGRSQPAPPSPRMAPTSTATVMAAAIAARAAARRDWAANSKGLESDLLDLAPLSVNERRAQLHAGSETSLLELSMGAPLPARLSGMRATHGSAASATLGRRTSNAATRLRGGDGSLDGSSGPRWCDDRAFGSTMFASVSGHSNVVWNPRSDAALLSRIASVELEVAALKEEFHGLLAELQAELALSEAAGNRETTSSSPAGGFAANDATGFDAAIAVAAMPSVGFFGVGEASLNSRGKVDG